MKGQNLETITASAQRIEAKKYDCRYEKNFVIYAIDTNISDFTIIGEELEF